ncbi:MAG TPA: hypothetical protein VJH68_01715 [Candidatus Nanoarchaeia archaeon]|nr:hypothetical protein [Candidatus Nanoarchaeia archaeon]
MVRYHKRPRRKRTKTAATKLRPRKALLRKGRWPGNKSKASKVKKLVRLAKLRKMRQPRTVLKKKKR